jgi:hypothetical protein
MIVSNVVWSPPALQLLRMLRIVTQIGRDIHDLYQIRI